MVTILNKTCYTVISHVTDLMSIMLSIWSAIFRVELSVFSPKELLQTTT